MSRRLQIYFAFTSVILIGIKFIHFFRLHNLFVVWFVTTCYTQSNMNFLRKRTHFRQKNTREILIFRRCHPQCFVSLRKLSFQETHRVARLHTDKIRLNFCLNLKDVKWKNGTSLGSHINIHKWIKYPYK